MKKVYFGVAALCAGAWMASCGGNKGLMSSSELGGEWNIVTVAGEQTTGEELPFIGLDMEAKRLYGYTGCNRMMGGFEVDTLNAGKIHFTQVATTRMMCPDMNLETKVVDALNKVAGYTETENGVALTDEKGNTLLTLSKRETPQVTVESLNGEWVIAAVNGAALEKMDKTPFLSFNVAEKHVHGNGGCNVINGGFMQEEGKPASLRFTQFISTMMAGPGMDVERKVLKAIDTVRSFTVKEDQSVALLDENGVEVLTLVKNEGEKLSK